MAAIVKRNGLPGRTPTTFAPLIRGRGEGFGVRTNVGSWYRWTSGLAPVVGDGRAGPVGMVVIHAVAGVAHLQDQLLDAREVHVHCLGRLLPSHHAARPERLAVADHAKLDDPLAGRLVVDADPRGEPAGRALEVEHQPRVGVGAEAVVEAPGRRSRAGGSRPTCPSPGLPQPWVAAPRSSAESRISSPAAAALRATMTSGAAENRMERKDSRGSHRWVLASSGLEIHACPIRNFA